MAENSGYDGNFLWKPVTDGGDGKSAVILVDSGLGSGNGMTLEVVDENGNVIERGRYKYDYTGGGKEKGRATFALSKPGSSYENVTVRVRTSDGRTAEYGISNGASRWEGSPGSLEATEGGGGGAGEAGANGAVNPTYYSRYQFGPDDGVVAGFGPSGTLPGQQGIMADMLLGMTGNGVNIPGSPFQNYGAGANQLANISGLMQMGMPGGGALGNLLMQSLLSDGSYNDGMGGVPFSMLAQMLGLATQDTPPAVDAGLSPTTNFNAYGNQGQFPFFMNQQPGGGQVTSEGEPVTDAQSAPDGAPVQQPAINNNNGTGFAFNQGNNSAPNASNSPDTTNSAVNRNTNLSASAIKKNEGKNSYTVKNASGSSAELKKNQPVDDGQGVWYYNKGKPEYVSYGQKRTGESNTVSRKKTGEMRGTHTPTQADQEGERGQGSRGGRDRDPGQEGYGDESGNVPVTLTTFDSGGGLLFDVRRPSQSETEEANTQLGQDYGANVVNDLYGQGSVVPEDMDYRDLFFTPIAPGNLPRVQSPLVDPLLSTVRTGNFSTDRYMAGVPLSQDLTMGLLASELMGLNAYVPAAAALTRNQLQQDQSFNFSRAAEANLQNMSMLPAINQADQAFLAASNDFNQRERIKNLEASTPGAMDAIQEGMGRGREMAKGRLLSTAEDRAYEMLARSAAADSNQMRGFGDDSTFGKRASEMLSAEQRLGLMSQGDSMTDRWLKTGASVAMDQPVKQNPLAARDVFQGVTPQVSGIGGQIRATPSISPASTTASFLNTLGAFNTIDPNTALNSQLSQNSNNAAMLYNRNNALFGTDYNAQAANQALQYDQMLTQISGGIANQRGKEAAAQNALNSQAAYNQMLLMWMIANNAARGKQQTDSITSSLSAAGSIAGLAAMCDGRFKEKVETYTPGLKEILRIKPVSFEYNDQLKEQFLEDKADMELISGRKIGVIAQELEEVLPEAVKQESYAGLENAKSIEIIPIVFTLVNAVKELHSLIEKLEERFNVLELKGNSYGG